MLFTVKRILTVAGISVMLLVILLTVWTGRRGSMPEIAVRQNPAFDESQIDQAASPQDSPKTEEPTTDMGSGSHQAKSRVSSDPDGGLLFDWRKPNRTNGVSGSNPVDLTLLRDDSFERKPKKAAPGLEFRRLTLMDENGVVPVDGLQKARRQMERMRASQDAKARASGEDPSKVEMAGMVPADWSWLGPGNVGGRIRSIIIDPANANNIWVGSVGGGIWRSTNGGTSWQPVNDFMANLAVSTMVMNPTNSTVMYAGTGEGFGNIDSLGGGGVFQSNDSGTTWNQLASTNPTVAPPPGCGVVNVSAPCPPFWQYVNRLAFSLDGTTLVAVANGGLALSTDGGTTWILRSSTQFTDVKFNPTSSSWAVAGGLGVARFSNDGGVTWAASSFNPAITNGATNATNGRAELAYAPSASSPAANATVYALVNNNSGILYSSTDGGQTFNLVNSVTNVLGAQGWYDNTLWVHPQNASFIIMGGIDLWRSTDSGANFAAISRWQCGPGQTTSCAGTSAHADQHVIVAHPGFDGVNNKQVFFGNDGGIFGTNDVTSVALQSGWTDLNRSLGITQFYGGAVNSSGKIIAGAQDNSTLLFAGDAQNWTVVVGGDGGYVAADQSDANFLYGETPNLGLFRSTDGGSTQSAVNTGIADSTGCALPAPTGPCSNFIAPFILDPNNANTMLAGGLSLWRSNDIKAVPPSPPPTWTAIKQPTAAPNPVNAPISAIAVAKGNSDLILVGHNDGQIYRSQDGTSTPANWTRIDNGTPGRFVTRLVIDDNHAPVWIYATFGGFSNNNVWRSTDLGVSWTDVSGTGATSLPNVPVRGLVVSQANPNFIYAGTEVGIFVSEDAGTTWLFPQQGPANVSVDELFWHNGNLVAVTHGRGIYRTRNPLYLTNASGSGGVCSPPPAAECACWGAWSCPCSWGSNRVPNHFDDVSVICNLAGGGNARNLSNRARIGGTVAVVQSLYNSGTLPSGVITGDLVNFGTIANTIDQDVIANQLFNTGLISVRDVKVQAVNGPGSTQAGNGNLVNFGTMQGRDIYIGVPTFLPEPGNISGNGAWIFQRGVIGIGTSAALAGPVSFRFGTLVNGGVFDVRTHTLTLNGSFDSFSDDSRFRGVLGTGLVQFAPTTIDGRTRLIASKQFLPSVRILSGVVNTFVSGNLLGVPAALGSVTVDNGATLSADTAITFGGNVLLNGTLAVDSACPSCTPNIDFNGDTFTNNGSVGPVRLFRFNSSGSSARNQQIVGTGTWLPVNLQIGGNAPSTSSLSLANDVIFSSNQFTIFPGSTLDLSTPDESTRTLSINTPANVFNYGSITGDPGRFMLQPATGVSTLYWDPPATLNADLQIAFGQVRMSTVSADIPIGRGLRVQDGATFSLSGSGISVAGSIQNDGTINTLAGLPVSFNFTGGLFVNNGTVTGSNLFTRFLSPNANPVSQSVTGTGTWSPTQLYVGNTSTVTLQNFLSFTGNSIFVDGQIRTGSFNLTLPCTTSWGGSGETFGNIRRTNLASCAGPVAYGNPFTTIQFNGGTTPLEATVTVSPSAPLDFTNAILRTYDISTLSGSGWTATLRLHYLDSELNGNAESTLNLFRRDATVWNLLGASNRNMTDNWVEYGGVNQFSRWTASSTLPLVPLRTVFDFDGDSKTDISIFRPAVGEWWYLKSSTGGNAALQFGNSSDKLVPGDFTGDGKADIAFWRPSTGFWFVLRSEDNSFFSFPFGTTGDIPAPADYDGDGKTDAAVFRPSVATWFIQRSSDGVITISTFGASTDKPVPADYDGDGKADIAIWRPSVGEWWYLKSSSSTVSALQFGSSTDRPVPGDFTGDGKADIAFWRPSNGFWFVLRSEDFSFFSFPFGASGDIPVAGDYDGDGRFDAAVFRTSNATWYLNRSTAGVLIQGFGLSSDLPVPAAFVP